MVVGLSVGSDAMISGAIVRTIASIFGKVMSIAGGGNMAKLLV